MSIAPSTPTDPHQSLRQVWTALARYLRAERVNSTESAVLATMVSRHTVFFVSLFAFLVLSYSLKSFYQLSAISGRDMSTRRFAYTILFNLIHRQPEEIMLPAALLAELPEVITDGDLPAVRTCYLISLNLDLSFLLPFFRTCVFRLRRVFQPHRRLSSRQPWPRPWRPRRLVPRRVSRRVTPTLDHRLSSPRRGLPRPEEVNTL
jgi:hypothetical protein